MTLWHCAREPLTVIGAFLHVGTIDQARMRGGGHLHEIVIEDVPSCRMRDRAENRWDPGRLVAARRRGHRLIVYLNRFEGIPLGEFEEARRRAGDIDAVSDAAFRKLLPSARDSWIILDPTIVKDITVREGANKGETP